ncbi:MAG: sigma-54-dependent Fis family transcriptional regulator [Pseudomonadota bacterium]
MKNSNSTDSQFHAADIEALEQRIVEVALERTAAHNGALFSWDADADGLRLDFHVIEGVTINLPGTVLRRRHDGRPNGIAFWALDHNAPYLCNDTVDDANYAPYFLEVRSVLAVPVPYQRRAIGVITVSASTPGAFGDEAVAELEALAASSAKFLRRAQLSRSSGHSGARPFLIKGLSPEWLDVERRVEHVAATDAPVLIQGESGTGKELVAHAVHFNSPRATQPFVTVNCAAIPETLLESTLFGHLRGAFSGASFEKVGEFKKADGGTLFLDELGELPMALQPKLLRAIEQGEVQPLGSNAPPLRVDVRLICATNRDLASQVRAGQFRDDLFFRVGVVQLQLPPLRSYKDNLEVMAYVFLRQASERHRVPAPRIAPEAMALLHAYDYPGNVRELKNAMEHAVIMAAGGNVTPAQLPRSMVAAPAPDTVVAAEPGTLRQLREAWLAPHETRYLTELMAACKGNVRLAASRAGVDAVTLYRLLKKRGLSLRRELRGDDGGAREL